VSAAPAGLRAVLFDLDGTLVDSAPDLGAALNAVLAERGVAPVTEAHVRRWVGNGARMLVSRAVAARGLPESAAEEALAAFMRHYERRLCERSRPYPGVVPALARLHGAGWPLACVTNKPERFVRPLLAALGLQAYFSVFVGGDTLARKKPDPMPLIFAAERLGVPPRATLMVGDSVADVEAAIAVPCTVACVDYGYNGGHHTAQAGVAAVVSSLVQLCDWLNVTE